MILDGLHRMDDPGTSRTATRLAAGCAIDVAARRRDPRPEWWMRVCIRCLVIAILLTALARIIAG